MAAAMPASCGGMICTPLLKYTCRVGSNLHCRPARWHQAAAPLQMYAYLSGSQSGLCCCSATKQGARLAFKTCAASIHIASCTTHFVSIVLFGIVACCDHDACCTTLQGNPGKSVQLLFRQQALETATARCRTCHGKQQPCLESHTKRYKGCRHKGAEQVDWHSLADEDGSSQVCELLAPVPGIKAWQAADSLVHVNSWGQQMHCSSC